MENRSSARLSGLLLALLLAGMAGVALAYSRAQGAADGALAAQRDLETCRRDLADMPVDVASGGSSGAADAIAPAFNRQLRSAATVAGIPDELVSIEPGTARRVGETDFNETLVFLRLNAVSLRQLVTFLHQLSSHDPNVRAKMLELNPPDAAPAAPGAARRNAEEIWTADVTLAYLSFSPRGKGGP